MSSDNGGVGRANLLLWTTRKGGQNIKKTTTTTHAWSHLGGQIMKNYQVKMESGVLMIQFLNSPRRLYWFLRKLLREKQYFCQPHGARRPGPGRSQVNFPTLGWDSKGWAMGMPLNQKTGFVKTARQPYWIWAPGRVIYHQPTGCNTAILTIANEIESSIKNVDRSWCHGARL